MLWEKLSPLRPPVSLCAMSLCVSVPLLFKARCATIVALDATNM